VVCFFSFEGSPPPTCFPHPPLRTSRPRRWRLRPKQPSPTSRTVLTVVALILTLVGGAWGGPKYRVLHAFGNAGDGAGVWDSVTLDGQGNVYGTTSGGGGSGCNGQGCGTVFELMPERDGKWSERLLYVFEGKPDASGAFGGVIFDGNGSLYGTTKYGGTFDYGTVFELTPSTGGWTENVLWSFDGSDGFEPWAGVVKDHIGNLYGTSPDGELVYELSHTSDQGTEMVIHRRISGLRWSFTALPAGTTGSVPLPD